MHIIDREDNRITLFKRIIYTVAIILCLYAIIFSYFNAYLAASIMILGLLIQIPISWCLLKKERYNLSKFILSLSCSFYVYICSATFHHQINAEHFYICAIMMPLILFELKEKKIIIASISATFLFWCISQFIGTDFYPADFFVNDPPLLTLKRINFVGAFALALSFLGVLLNVIQNLTEKIIDQNKTEREFFEKSKKMTEALKRTERIASIGSWTLEFAGEKLEWSDETYRIHEVEIGSTLNVQEAIKFYHPDYRDKISKYVDRGINEGIPWDDEFKFITAKGKHLWIRAIGRIIRDQNDNPTGAEGSFQDITKQKEASLAKDEFLSVVSHEMRTPLNSIIGVTDLLRETNLTEKQSDYLKLIEQGGDTILTIVDDILDLSKLNNEKLKLNLIEENLSKIFDDVYKIMKPLAEEKGLSFSINKDIPEQVFKCDALRVRQICFNLIANAVKFTDQGEVNFNIAPFEKGENGLTVVSFEVSDSGIGIPPQFMDKLFKPFEQHEHGKTLRKGTGLGLSICKSLCELMNGSISVTSTPGKGTTFKVQITLEEVKEKLKGNKIETVKELMEDFSSKRILYADDTKSNQIILKGFLKSTRCHLDIVDNGQLALEKYKNDQSYDAIIMDVQMPVMNGLEATEKIRIFENSNNIEPIKIIAFSAFAFEQDKEKALSAGCNFHLSKPAKKIELIEVLTVAFSKE